MKIAFTFLLVINSFCQLAFAQNIVVLEKGIKLPSLKEGRLELINQKLDISNFEKVARLEGKAIKAEEGSIEKLFSSFRYTSKKMGANAYVVDTVIYKKAVMTINLTVYFLPDSILKRNKSYRIKNEVYLFGSLYKTKSTINAKINNENLSIDPLHFKKHTLKIGEEFTLLVGKVLGSRVSLFRNEYATSIYYKLGKYSVSFQTDPFSYNSNIGFSGGDISEIDEELGIFLANILIEN